MVYGLNQQPNIQYRGQNAAFAGTVKDVVPQNIAQKLPENVQNFDAKQSTQEVVKNNPAVQTLKTMGIDVTDPMVAGGTLGLWALFLNTRNFLDKKFGGKWEDSLLGKISKFGDKTTGVFYKIPGVEKTSKAISGGSRKLYGFLEKHFDILKSSKTPLRLENTMAKSQANGIAGFVSSNDLKDFLGHFSLNNSGDLTKVFDNLADIIGKEKADTFLSGLGKLEREAAKQAKREAASKAVKKMRWHPNSGSSKYAVAKDAMREAVKSGKVDDAVRVAKNSRIIELLTPVLDSPVENKAAIKKLAEQMSKHGDLKITVKSALNKYSPLKFLNLNLTMGEMANKLIGTTKQGGKTFLGKNLPYLTGASTEGLTSMFAGKKIGPLMAAAFLAASFKRAMDAPKGQRLATFMDEEVLMASSLALIPYQTQILTKVGGALKYMGMGKTTELQKANVQKYRDAIKNLNANVDNMTIGQYHLEKANIKNLLKGEGPKWKQLVQKPFKFIGKIIGSGFEAETIKPFTQNTKGIGGEIFNLGQKALYALKTGINTPFGKVPGISGLLRFGLAFFVVGSLLQKPIKFVVNKIFGKPYDKEKEEAEKVQKEKEQKELNAQNVLQQNPQIIENIMKTPDLAAQIQQRPELLIDLLNDPNTVKMLTNKAADNVNNAAGQNTGRSQMLDNFLNLTKPDIQNQTNTQSQNIQSQAPNNPGVNTKVQNNTLNQNQNAFDNASKPALESADKNNEAEEQEPQRSYIPSSKPAQTIAQKGNELNGDVQLMLSKADKAEANAVKYL